MQIKNLIKIFLLIILVLISFYITCNSAYESVEGKFYIDTPIASYIAGKNIIIEGWYLSTDLDATMKVYIDNNDTGAIVSERKEREDVLIAIPGYGGREKNPEPGFKMVVDLSNISYGSHTIKYVLVDKDENEIISQTRKITIDSRTKGKFYIDTPTGNLYEGKNIKIAGWIMSNDSKATMEVYIDGINTGAIIDKRNIREDVLKIISGYGSREKNPKPGFEMTVNLNNISYGEHTVKYVLVDENKNEILSQTRKITIDSRAKGRFYIDSPSQTIDTYKVKDSILEISGWMLCNDENATMKVLVDGNDSETIMSKRMEREDVLNKIKGYGGRDINPMPGFEMHVDLSKYSVGEHIFTYELVSSNGEKIAQTTQNINIKKAEFFIDAPTRSYFDLKMVPIKGWMLSVDKDAIFKVLINGEEVEISNFKRVERPDVLKAKKGYGGAEMNPEPGFECVIDLSSYNKGNYELTYFIEGINGEVFAEEKKNIKIDYTPRAKICIDTPSSNGVDNVVGNISGWLMTNIENPILEIYIDNELITETQKRVVRDDVINSIGGYGGIENNPTPGFSINIDYSKYSIGTHSIKAVIKDADDNNRELTSILQTFNVWQQYTVESGTYGLSGQGRALRYYKIGDGPNVYFTTFTVHGFEDKWNYDGQELTYIAEQFKNRLESERDRNILSKWTIYIFPEVNPDGAQAGWSNNGPGRKTLYSWAPNNQGVDINRCWSTGYKRMTGRNYNGTEPFQAPEVANLRDFLLNNRANNGQTVLVDLHGWTTQLIGDYGICNDFYRAQFPNNTYTSTYGNGYLVNWARSNLGANGRAARAALIELPSNGINSHQDVINNNYAGRYIEATLSMLRNL